MYNALWRNNVLQTMLYVSIDMIMFDYQQK